MKSNLSKAQIIYAYTLNKNLSVKPNAPVKGFYYITDILELEVTERVKKMWVHALWHPTEADFTNSVQFKVQLSYLFNKQSIGLKEISPDYLINAVIQIHSIQPAEGEYNGEKYLTTSVNWEIVDFLSVFAGPQVNFQNTWTNFIAFEQMNVLEGIKQQQHATNQVQELSYDDLNDLYQLLLDEELSTINGWENQNELDQLIYDEIMAAEYDSNVDLSEALADASEVKSPNAK